MIEESPMRVYEKQVLEKNEVNFSVSTINNSLLEED